VEAINFQTLFTCCQGQAAQAAAELGVRLTVLCTDDGYLDLIRRPEHGYGRGANPCVDCRIYMFRAAARCMLQAGADLVISGEVVGQRPMSQKKRDLAVIARHSGLEDRLLRPLSAKLLPPTLAERTGLIDRSRLHSFSGRSRKGLIALARRLGLSRIPAPSTGCALTEPAMGVKVRDLIQLQPAGSRWDFELLKIGRHVRYNSQTKVVLGRREEENGALLRMFRREDASSCALLTPDNFNGPVALVCGECDDQATRFAGGLIWRFSRLADSSESVIRVLQSGQLRTILACPHPAASEAAPL
jgi:hypothetical protein